MTTTQKEDVLQGLLTMAMAADMMAKAYRDGFLVVAENAPADAKERLAGSFDAVATIAPPLRPIMLRLGLTAVGRMIDPT